MNPYRFTVRNVWESMIIAEAIIRSLVKLTYAYPTPFKPLCSAHQIFANFIFDFLALFSSKF